MKAFLRPVFVVSMLALSSVGIAEQRQEMLSSQLQLTPSTVLPSAKFEGYVRSMIKQFDYICGDTFCEGDYANLVSIEFDCVLNKTSQEVSDCQWLFAGSESWVGSDDVVHRDAKLFQCKIPFSGDLAAFASFLKAASAYSRSSSQMGIYNATISGAGDKTLVDVLGDCFN